ncbi:MAG TPA: alpha/beta fold hydrolase [Holophaga sp.]|jgi:predicted alpha/beta hydrolase family esterase|nr:alpha/beta fold hydrolase [Holophaga sp.]
MRSILFIPGYGNSGPGHWQSLWEGNIPTAIRVEMPSWDFPHRADWVNALDDAIERTSYDEPPVLVAHSIGCIAVAHWALEHQRPIHGAFLVAPSDPERPDALEILKSFAPVPQFALPFPSHVVASSNDPFVDLERARDFADAWRSSFTEIGPKGHINTASGFGEWPRGEALLHEIVMS